MPGSGSFLDESEKNRRRAFYASSEKNRMLACRFGEHRDNSRNSQSVFLVVLANISIMRQISYTALFRNNFLRSR